MPQIKFLNNLLLAFITQEFSLAVIRSKTLKQSILIVQGVNLVRLCVIQFTRYISRRSPQRPIYISTPFLICQDVFSSFYKFLFEVLISGPLRSALEYTNR